MVSGTVRRAAAIAGALAFAGGGAVIAYAQQQNEPPCTPHAGSGGLAFCAPGQADESVTVNRAAQAGAADTIVLMNNSRNALEVTAKARPWTQSASGAVVPNRRGTLGGVTLSEQSFTLAPGSRRELTVTLNSVPSSGYLYGALEVIGLPADLQQRSGVVAGYRLVNSLRYTAATARSSIKTGAVKFVGQGKAKALTLAVRNTGNTLEPVSGRLKLTSALGTKNSSVKATRILPGKSVRLALLSAGALRPGTYKATITLTQAKKKTTVTKKITVRR